MSYLCPNCNRFPLRRLHLPSKTTSGGSLGEEGATIGVERNTTGSNQTSFWSYKQVKVSIRPRSSKRMQYLRACAQI